MYQGTDRKKWGKRPLFICILVLAAGAVSVWGAEGITGEWDMTLDYDGRESFATLSISKAAGGALTGKWGSSELSSVKFEGDKLSFVRTLRFGDNEYKTTYEGTLKDGKLLGKITSERGTYGANGARFKPLPAVVGQWNVKYAYGEREINAKLSITQKKDGTLDGKWVSGTRESKISNVRFQNGKLTLTRTSTYNNNERTSTYEAAVKGHALTGKLKSERGEREANGTRVGAGLIGKWELTTTSDRGTRTRMLKIFGDLSGRYESFGSEIPVKDLKLDGDQVTFALEYGFGDRTFKSAFKGKLDGTTLDGELTSDRGTSKVAGKKIEAASALFGKWEFTRETSRGTRTSVLTLGEDKTGTYSYRDNTVDLQDLQIDGDQVSFKVTFKTEDREYSSTFKGRVDGKTLKGTFTSSRGDREATGKKVE